MTSREFQNLTRPLTPYQPALYLPLFTSLFSANAIHMILRLQVMRLLLNINFQWHICYKSMKTFRFTSWILSLMNKSMKDTTFKSCGKLIYVR